MKPCMAIAITQDQQVVGHMLAVIVTRRWFLPPISLRYGHVYGEGCYAPNADTSRIFGLLLMAVTNKFKHELCLFAEFSNISKKMFGYRQFRKQGYVPIPWQEIHNSLHSMPPENRLSERQLQQIKEISDHGVEVRPCANDEERHLYISLLRKHFMLKSRRYIPDERLGCPARRRQPRSPHSRPMRSPPCRPAAGRPRYSRRTGRTRGRMPR